MGAPNRDAIWSLYDRLYKTIRAIDPDHIITIESCWSGRVEGRDIGWSWEVLPRPGRLGWTNMLYQHHNYEWNWNDPQQQIRSTDHIVQEWLRNKSYNVPVFIGEFNCMNAPDAWVHAVNAYTTNNMSWAIWNYKATSGIGNNSWGLYNPKQPMPPKPDLQKDSADEISAKWSRWSTSESFAENPMIARRFEVSPGDLRLANDRIGEEKGTLLMVVRVQRHHGLRRQRGRLDAKGDTLLFSLWERKKPI